MDTSEFSEEMESLNAQIEPLQEQVVLLEDELRAVDDELGAYAVEHQQTELLNDACAALERLAAIGAGDLFWEGLPQPVDGQAHCARVRDRIAGVAEQTRELEERKKSLQAQMEQHLSVLDYLFDEAHQARMREERRQEEFLVEREFVPLPFHPAVMPWMTHEESENRFRRAVLISLLLCLLFGGVIPLISVPIPDRANLVVEVPERLAMLLKEELPPPPPAQIEKQEPEKIEPEKKETKPTEKKTETVAEKKPVKAKKPANTGSGAPKGARNKTENIGVLAFKSSFSDLMDEVPVAKLGADAKVKNVDRKIPGQARVQRSLVATQAKGGSGQGISNFGVSRNLGNGGSGGGSGYGRAGQLGEVGTAKVASSVSGLTEEAGRPLSDGIGPARTDEEIQIVFDRYKATLYRIYNKELRKDPTLRGKLLIRLTIEPDGAVSMCKVESTDLASQELVEKIVARIKRFNFGPKEGVPQVTILYPIDFLPAG